MRFDTVPEPTSRAEPDSGGESKAADEDGQASAKSALDEEMKPAEVADSESTNTETNIASPKVEDRPKSDQKQGRNEDAEDEIEHVVEGDEDTVIY